MKCKTFYLPYLCQNEYSAVIEWNNQFIVLFTNYRERNSNDVKSVTESKLQTLVNSHKAKIKDLVADQTKEWSQMVQLQMTEEHELRKAHVLQQSALLKTLMEQAQAQQLKDLEAKQEK